MSAQENAVRIDLPFFTDFRTFTVFSNPNFSISLIFSTIFDLIFPVQRYRTGSGSHFCVVLPRNIFIDLFELCHPGGMHVWLHGSLGIADVSGSAMPV